METLSTLGKPVFSSQSPFLDTRDADAVHAFVQDKFALMFDHEKPQWLDRLFRDVTRLFEGKHPDYAAIDLHYHDFEHTLQATVCLTQILESRHYSGSNPVLTPRDFEIAVAAVLLHDTGYLRLRSDREGTGAKYTFIHEVRSCAFAASYLPNLGATAIEIESVVSAISCTGPRSFIRRIQFPSPLACIIGCVVATADYLAQMAAPDYLDRLTFLFSEFEESYDFLNTPESARPFKSLRDMIRSTPDFWEKIVLPKLNDEFQAVYRYLECPYPGGPNSYLESIEHNLLKARSLTAVF